MFKMGYTIGVFDAAHAEHEQYPDFQFYDRLPFVSKNSFTASGSIKVQYGAALEDFRPTHVFIIGVAINKYFAYYDLAYERGIKVIAHWLINDFYCQKNWAVRNEKACFECNNGSFSKSIVHNCCNDNRQISKLSRRKEQFSGYVMRRLNMGRWMKLHKVIGSCDAQLDMYRRLGHREDQIAKCPFFYDKTRLVQIATVRGKYFIFLGQHSETKGWPVISRIIDRCPGIPFLVPIMNSNDDPIARFDLERHVETGQLTVIKGTSWGTGTEKYLAEACGVINPSIWETTTESVLMESLGLGKPVVVFSQGIHREVFRDGENGMMVELGDLDGFAERVKRISAMPEAGYSAMSDKAKELFHFLADDERYMTAIREAFC